MYAKILQQNDFVETCGSAFFVYVYMHLIKQFNSLTMIDTIYLVQWPRSNVSPCAARGLGFEVQLLQWFIMLCYCAVCFRFYLQPSFVKKYCHSFCNVNSFRLSKPNKLHILWPCVMVSRYRQSNLIEAPASQPLHQHLLLIRNKLQSRKAFQNIVK